MTKLSPEEIKRIEAEAEAYVRKHISFDGLEHLIGGNVHNENVQSYLAGATAEREKAQPLVEAMKLIKQGNTSACEVPYVELQRIADAALNAYLAGGIE